MKNVRKNPWFVLFLGLIIGLGGKSGQAQDWNATAFSLNSRQGNAICHRPNQNYGFIYTVYKPPSGLNYDRANNRIRENYTLEYVRVIDINGKASLMDGTERRRRLQSLLSSDNITVNYEESWREDDIRLELEARIRYKRTIELYNANENSYGDPQTQADTTVNLRSGVSVFDLGDFLTDPQTILIDGIAKRWFTVDPLKGCQNYTLNTGVVEGVDRYRWSVNPGNILLSGVASLNTNTIQVRPTFGNMPSSVRLELIQECSGDRIKSKNFPIVASIPITVSRPIICYNGGQTQLSIPPPSAGVSVNWTVDNSKCIVLKKVDRDVEHLY